MNLKTVGLSLCLVTMCACVLAIPAWTHHSHGNYQMTEYMNVEGTVQEIHWINPHSWIYLEVTDEDGESELWALEGASVVELRRGGWTEDSVETGDKVSARCHRLRDGSNGCLLGYLTTEDGVEKLFD